RFLGDRDELGRADLPPLLVGPARERLEARDLARFEIDQRLVKQLELVLVERPAKLGFDRETAARLGRLARLVDLWTTLGFGLLDRELRVAEQLFRLLAGGHQGHADRAFDADLQLRKLEWSSHHLPDSLGRLECVLDAPAERHENAELITTGACKHVSD